tara:strand:- start:1766 stop:3172 length:1407 start_codon:yes stop_codon:yes gene_type:complete
LHWIDFSLVILFLISFSIFGFWQVNKNKSSGDYFLAGKDLPWPVAMLSIVATETSVLTFISIPGLAFRGEWFFLQLGFGYIIGRILVSIFLLPSYFEFGVVSIYEVIGRRYGLFFQKVASLIFLVTRILADGVRFLATAVVVQVITGWSIEIAVLIIGAVTLVYTLTGGLRAVIWIDSVQFILYLLGGIISIYVALNYLDMPLNEIFSNLSNSNKIRILNFEGSLFNNPYYFFSAVLGGIFLSFSSHGIDHMMVQRVLSTRDLSSARKSMIASGFFVLMQFAIFLFAGSLIFLIAGDIGIQKDREFTYFIVNYLPVGVRGILLAGVLSAAMSTLSSSINSLASSTVTDWFKGRSDVAFSRLVSLIWGVVLIGIALIFDEGDSAIIIVGLQIASFTYGALLGLFLLSKLEYNFLPSSLIVGLTSSILTVFVLKQNQFAWTSFIMFSVLANITSTVLVDYFHRLAYRSNR